MAKSKPSTGKQSSNNSKKPSRGGFGDSIEKGRSIPIGDNVQGNTTTTSTGPKSPAGKKQ